MKNKFVDLSYFSFEVEQNKDVLKICQSTIGFLQEMTTIFDCYFIARVNIPDKDFNFNGLKVFLRNGIQLQKWQIPFRFNWFIKSFQPDYILVHGFGYAHYLFFLKLICPKAKIILQCNGFAPKPKGLKKKVYKFSDIFIAGYLFTGEENAKEWCNAKIFKKEKVFEVMEGSTYFKVNHKITRIENTYLWVGNLDENKDPITILKAFELFLEQNPSVKLTMIFQGDFLLNEVNTMLSINKKLKESVFLKGFVEHHLLERIYNQHQFFILGSHYEGSGYALLEAMACGCVPIVTHIPSYKFMTNNGDCALLFSPENIEELLSQLNQSQKIDYLCYQKKVVEQFEKKLSFKAIAKNIENIFYSL